MFERFTERARNVVVFAQDEARLLKHNYIGTEHLLLGLLRDDEGVAARVLDAFVVTLDDVRARVGNIVGEGDEVVSGQIPFTPRAKKVLELSLREALSLGHDYIGTEHILLAVVREGGGVGARILFDLGVDDDRAREAVLTMLGAEPTAGPGFVPESPPVAPEVIAELERVRREKQQALDDQEFERAAALRDRERRLALGARDLTRAWLDEPELPRQGGWSTGVVRAVPVPGVERRRGRRAERRRTWHTEAVVVGWVLFGVAAGLGVLLGWLIWG